MKRDTRKYQVRNETWEEKDILNPQAINPGLVLEYKGKVYPLGCGTSDGVSVFRYGKGFAVLSVSSGLDYAGLQIIDLGDCARDNEVFIENISSNLNPELSKDFFDYSDNVQADILAQYLEY